MNRLYTLIHHPSEPSERGDLLIESAHPEAISAVIKGLKLTEYWTEKDLPPLPDGTPQIDIKIVYQTTFA